MPDTKVITQKLTHTPTAKTANLALDTYLERLAKNRANFLQVLSAGNQSEIAAFLNNLQESEFIEDLEVQHIHDFYNREPLAKASGNIELTQVTFEQVNSFIDLMNLDQQDQEKAKRALNSVPTRMRYVRFTSIAALFIFICAIVMFIQQNANKNDALDLTSTQMRQLATLSATTAPIVITNTSSTAEGTPVQSNSGLVRVQVSNNLDNVTLYAQPGNNYSSSELGEYFDNTDSDYRLIIPSMQDAIYMLDGNNKPLVYAELGTLYISQEFTGNVQLFVPEGMQINNRGNITSFATTSNGVREEALAANYTIYAEGEYGVIQLYTSPDGLSATNYIRVNALNPNSEE